MSTLYYAVGGGLGHVTRAQRVLRALDISDAVVVTSCDAELDFPVIRVGEEDSVAEIVARTSADRVIVDAFPAGIRGELTGVRAPRVDYVARRLRWERYRRECPVDFHFHAAYVVEELEDEHRRWVELHSDQVELLNLAPPAARADVDAFWLIVHSGPAHEVRELMEYARELAVLRGESPRVLVATRCDVELPDGFERTETIAYANAARIISAAGFNVMMETEPWAEKHHVVPFPRRFDDQFARAALRRRRLCG